MAFDHKRRLIFVHVPKTGGTAIAKALQCGQGHCRVSHVPFSEYPNYRSFAAIRDPIDRFVSAYDYVTMDKSYWHEAGTSTEHPDYRLCRSLTIDEVVDRMHRKTIAFRAMHFDTQSKYLLKGGRMVLDHLLRYESLQSDLDAMFDLYGLKRVVLPAVNASHRHSVITSESRRKLRNIYASDFELINQHTC